MALMSGTRRGAFRQRAISHPFQDDGNSRGHRHPQQNHQKERRQRVPLQEADPARALARKYPTEGPGHEDVAVGEVDHAQNAVDHGVAERDQSIDAASRMPNTTKSIHCSAVYFPPVMVRMVPTTTTPTTRMRKPHRNPDHGPLGQSFNKTRAHAALRWGVGKRDESGVSA